MVKRFFEQSLLVAQIIGNQAFSAVSVPQSIRGVSSQLLMACWANGDSYALYLKNASSQQHQQLCTRSWSSDSMELYFSALNHSLGGQKPTPQKAEQHLMLTDHIAAAKANPHTRLHVPHSRRQQYSCHALQKATGWNDGSAETEQSAATAKRAKKVDTVARIKAKGKQTVRGFHK
ncbi:TPA: hypothetical protein ACH3X2_009401 [Trebouxia sp. C0005]